MDLANEFRQILVAKKMKMRDLADKIGISQSWLSKTFIKNDFNLQEIKTIAKALDCEVQLYFKKDHQEVNIIDSEITTKSNLKLSDLETIATVLKYEIKLIINR